MEVHLWEIRTTGSQKDDASLLPCYIRGYVDVACEKPFVSNLVVRSSSDGESKKKGYSYVVCEEGQLFRVRKPAETFRRNLIQHHGIHLLENDGFLLDLTTMPEIVKTFPHKPTKYFCPVVKDIATELPRVEEALKEIRAFSNLGTMTPFVKQFLATDMFIDEETKDVWFSEAQLLVSGAVLTETETVVPKTASINGRRLLPYPVHRVDDWSLVDASRGMVPVSMVLIRGGMTADGHAWESAFIEAIDTAGHVHTRNKDVYKLGTPNPDFALRMLKEHAVVLHAEMKLWEMHDLFFNTPRTQFRTHVHRLSLWTHSDAPTQIYISTLRLLHEQENKTDPLTSDEKAFLEQLVSGKPLGEWNAPPTSSPRVEESYFSLYCRKTHPQYATTAAKYTKRLTYKNQCL